MADFSSGRLKKKCIFILGPESSGSRLISKIIAHALEIQNFDSWNGSGWMYSKTHKICHESLPAGDESKFPDIDGWISENRENYELNFVLTTRDITISECSRIDRFAKPLHQVQKESAIARKIIRDILHNEFKTMFWSYETFMYMGNTYLELLYNFLEIDSDFFPVLVDGNKARLMGGKLPFQHNRLVRFFKKIIP